MVEWPLKKCPQYCFEDIAVNKICAIFGRQPPETKDFVDLYFILEESRFELDYLIARAREKEAAFDQEDGILTFATNLLGVDELHILPRMVHSFTLEALRSYFIPLAEKVLRGLRPRGR